jgi:hypothetical protein
MRQSRTSGSVGAGGGRPPSATRLPRTARGTPRRRLGFPCRPLLSFPPRPTKVGFLRTDRGVPGRIHARRLLLRPSVLETMPRSRLPRDGT